MAKTIVFCDNQNHAERMRQALVTLIPAAASNRRYVMRIIGDDKEGKAQISYFIDNDEPYPVIATTSKLLTTGVDAKTCKLIVLDKNINSMTEFKQIVGRGTRIREDYHKLFFTVMDFKNATRLFADPNFDGELVVIYEPGPDDSIIPPQNEIQSNEDPISFAIGKDDLKINVRPSRFIIDDVKVCDGFWREQYLDADGKLITEDYRVFLKKEIKKTLQGEFGSLQNFLNRWRSSERKRVIIEELKEQGINLEILQQAVPNAKEFDLFDLVSHIAFDQNPLTRKERVNQVKKQNYFGKYGDQAKKVLEALLEKYANNGIADIEDPKILELPPFQQWGSKTHIRRKIFGGPDKFSQALTELEQALYTTIRA